MLFLLPDQQHQRTKAQKLPMINTEQPWRLATLRGEGHSAAGWGIGESVIAADCWVLRPFIRAMGGRYLRCATSVIAGQYATSEL